MKYKLHFNKAQDGELIQVQEVVRLLKTLGYKKVGGGNVVTLKNSNDKYIYIYTHNKEKAIVPMSAFSTGNYFTEEETKILMDAAYDRTGNTDSIISFLQGKNYRLTRLSPTRHFVFYKETSDSSSSIDLYVDEAEKLISACNSDDYKRTRIPLEPVVGKFFDSLGYKYSNYSTAKDPIFIEDWFE